MLILVGISKLLADAKRWLRPSACHYSCNCKLLSSTHSAHQGTQQGRLDAGARYASGCARPGSRAAGPQRQLDRVTQKRCAL